MKTKMLIKNQKGASAVEFAIVLPLMLVLIFGIIEFSILFYNKAMITNASREGARAGIVFAVSRPSQADIQAIVDNYAANHLINFDPSQNLTTTAVWTDTNGDTAISAGEPLTVTVNYTYKFLALPNIIALVRGSFSNTQPINAVTVMMYE
jgi:Flp pilus assembly protein TadG